MIAKDVYELVVGLRRSSTSMLEMVDLDIVSIPSDVAKTLNEEITQLMGTLPNVPGGDIAIYPARQAGNLLDKVVAQGDKIDKNTRRKMLTDANSLLERVESDISGVVTKLP